MNHPNVNNFEKSCALTITGFGSWPAPILKVIKLSATAHKKVQYYFRIFFNNTKATNNKNLKT